MTYAELKASKTSGFNTNHVIDDVISNGRFCFGKGFEVMLVSAHDLSTIKTWADKEGVSFPPNDKGKAFYDVPAPIFGAQGSDAVFTVGGR